MDDKDDDIGRGGSPVQREIGGELCGRLQDDNTQMKDYATPPDTTVTTAGRRAPSADRRVVDRTTTARVHDSSEQ